MGLLDSRFFAFQFCDVAILAGHHSTRGIAQNLTTLRHIFHKNILCMSHSRFFFGAN